ncbi:MAG TPA: SprT-like domain-containing protein [candidate division Zixibacteria bacterium]|nr:SprT-like domain-containing protein [candidate division Zixibacteria bacterium]
MAERRTVRRKAVPEPQVRRRRRTISKQLARALNRDLFEGALGVALESPAAPSRAFAKPPDKLPSLAELYRLFDMYNLVHFDGNLPRVKLTYSARMLAAGSCAPYDKEIRIGVRYHQLFPEDLDDTLIHEMIHLIHPTHDRDFKRVANRLGVSVYARSHPDLRRPPKYLYECPGCQRRYPRQKRLRLTSCGMCSGSRYNERFKLRLVPSEPDTRQ